MLEIIVYWVAIAILFVLFIGVIYHLVFPKLTKQEVYAVLSSEWKHPSDVRREVEQSRKCRVGPFETFRVLESLVNDGYVERDLKSRKVKSGFDKIKYGGKDGPESYHFRKRPDGARHSASFAKARRERRWRCSLLGTTYSQ